MKYLITIFVAVMLGAFSQNEVLADKESDAKLTAGKELTFNRKKGNCLACHQIADGSLNGNVAPPLFHMKARFPDKAVLRAQIWDSRVKNKTTVMPPFGTHGILSAKEIDLIVDYIYSL